MDVKKYLLIGMKIKLALTVGANTVLALRSSILSP